MMPITKAISISLNFISFILLIFLFIIGKIKCDCSKCKKENENPPDCPSSCKKTLLYDNFYCDISGSNTNKYFYVNNENEKNCFPIDKCPSINYDKVVAGTNECVLNCAHFYEIGDFCFESKPSEDEYDNIPFTNKYKCKKYTYIKIIDGKDYHICVDKPTSSEGDNNKCPFLYFDEDDKICKESCENKKIKQIINNGKLYYECRNECEYKEEPTSKKDYEYHESIDDANSNIIYCLSSCPAKTPYYYYISDKISPKCIKKCESKHFYNNENKCSSYCETSYIVEDSKDFFKCLDGINEETKKGLINDLFIYQKAYLKNCKETQSDITFNKKTYSYIKKEEEEVKEKRCVDDCFSYDNTFYSDEESLSCVEKCSQTSNIFHYNHKCYKSCSLLNKDEKTFKYIKTSLESISLGDAESNSNELECVAECPSNYYLLSNEICIKYCPKSSENSYASIKEKKCTTCKKEEGFILYSELTEVTTSPKNIFCYESCPPDTYYKINDNICYKLSIEDKTCYFPEDNKAICYPSCKDIPGGYIYENNNICFKEFNCGDKYYYKIGEMTKCIENDGTNSNHIKECARQNLNYLKGKECVSDCDPNEYKIEPEKTIYTGVITLGKCCSSPTCDASYKYYSEDDKILHKTCSLKAIDNLESPKISKKGTCVATCPEDFPYEKDNICSSICSQYYYVAKDKKSCVESCASINKFYFEGEKECLDSCSKSIEGTKQYFYYSGDKCYSSCSLINKFSLDINLNHFHQKCLDSCPDQYKYYFENDLICLPNCDGGFYESVTSSKCVSQCNSDEVVIDGNTCSSQCNSQEPFSAYINQNNVFINKCVTNCKEHGYDFFYKNKCMKECPKEEAPYHYKDGMECLENCPEGYFSDANICLTKCNESPYFILDDKKKFYKCVQNCDSSIYYISSTGECVEKCHIGENFIGKNKKCKNFCDENEDGKYYKLFKKETPSEGMEYNIYLCVNTYGSNEYLVDGSKEIVTENCTNNKPYLSINGNICYKDCKNDPLYPFSTEEGEGGKKICSFECKSETNKYFDKEEKICLPNCDIYSNNIINEEDNSCVSKCNLNSLFKFQTQKEENGKVYCSKACELDGKKKYSENDYICTDKCLPPYNFVDGDLCLDKCPENKFIEIEGIASNEYNCVDKCEEGKYYYEKDRICVSNCENGYVIQNSNICTQDCSSVSNEIEYHFYDYQSPEPEPGETSSTEYDKNTCVTKCPKDKPFLREDNHCYNKCNLETFKYYIEEEKKCLEKCPPNMVIDEEDISAGSSSATETHGKICKASCPTEKFLDTKTKNCISDCNESKMREYYYIPGENICLEKCNNALYKDGYKCVSSCPDEGNIYLDTITNNCVNKCTEGKNYVIKEFTHGEEDTQKKCLQNCTEVYPYYIVNETLDINECVSLCSYYVLPNKEYPIPIKCYTDKCPDGYKYFVKYDNGTSQCFMSCPNDMKFYDSSNQCYEKCPENTPYFKFNSNECFGECNNKIDYKTKECVMDCSYNQKWAKGEDEKIYCLDECNTEFGIFLSGKECVKKCDSVKFLINDITDPLNKKCNCENLFYLDDSGNKVCFNPLTRECGETGSDAVEYIYRIYNGSDPTNECSKHCFGLLSPSEDKCYINVENCDDIDIKNTTLIIGENKLKCDCKFRYYIDTNNKKICLEDECSEQKYSYYIPDKKECVRNCEGVYSKIFDNKCFEDCPGGSSYSASEGICKCTNYFYRIGENNYKCTETGTCPSEYPYLIEETQECVKKCEGTDYEIFYKNQCYSSCSSITGMKLSKIESVDERVKSIAPYTCQCDNIWYYDSNGEIECTTSTEVQECLEHNFRFLIKDTNQCINSCPIDYPFSFSNECFKSCEDANSKYQYPIKAKNGSNECVCDNLWKKNENNKIECLTDVVCEELMVKDTNECVEECPPEYPLKFNNKCFKNCPDGTKEDITTSDKCICNNLWYTQKNGNMFCFEGEECPPSHPYKKSSNNECQQQKCEKFILNYTCYEECPQGTKPEDTTSSVAEAKICECDPELGYWYREGDYYPRMFCELKKCPNDKKYYKNDNKECLRDCGENGLYEYNNICYEGGCPEPTLSENPKTNKYKCITKKYMEATSLNETYQFLKEEIVELYRSVPKEGIIYKKYSSTIQIYGIAREDSDLKNTILRSSLSYIDISACSKKVFENNKMQENDEIVVIKYDLENQQNKSLVKPVEYEFINSRTGQLLDMSVCTKNDVVISYSLSNILNYIKKKQERRLEEAPDDEDIISQIQDQYEKGKIITSIYNIDSFNINSSLYQDLCFSLELDGKDLVLEDRVKLLFPYYSLCEENCTYSHTDFDTERIYCNCPLKKEFNLEREHKFVINTYNNDEIISKQKGPTNIPVMTCMSRLKEKKSITKNGGFFYSLIVFIIEFALFLITIFYSYKLFIQKVYRISDRDEDIEKLFDIEEITINHRKNIKTRNNTNEVNIKTSERALDSPPKRREIDEINPMDIKLEEKIEKIEKQKADNDGTKTDDQKSNIDESMNESFSREYLLGIMDSIKKEEKLLRVKFDTAISNDESDIFITLLTEICDKIYFIKSIFLLGKYDIFTIYFSVYILYHLLLLTFTTCFYDIKTIQKIWNKENYPNLQYSLTYGFLSCLIVWVIYKIFLCIISNEGSIKRYLRAKLNKANKDGNKLQKKFDDFKFKVKVRMIIYFVLMFIVCIVCLLYITTFCAVYTGTKKYVFRTYGIALVEVLIIKIVYGIVLGIIRKVGLNKQNRTLYKIAYYFDKLIH